jgi:hypothetical protein
MITKLLTGQKIYQTAVKFQNGQKYTNILYSKAQIDIFGMEIYHLATLLRIRIVAPIGSALGLGTPTWSKPPIRRTRPPLLEAMPRPFLAPYIETLMCTYISQESLLQTG